MAMPNEFYKKQCHVWYFYSPFHISTALLIYLQKWSSFALPSCAYSTCNFASPTPNFCLIRAVRFLSRQILSRRQHAPNKWCALNNKCAPDNAILRYTCDLLVSFPDTFSLVSECLGMRLVSCAFCENIHKSHWWTLLLHVDESHFSLIHLHMYIEVSFNQLLLSESSWSFNLFVFLSTKHEKVCHVT